MSQNKKQTHQEWQTDILGPTFQYISIPMPDDYTGKVRCTIIRKLADKPSDKAIVYVHGYSDYFFQTEMAETFAKAGYNFYAVDLRRYGRSLLPGQKMFQVRNLDEYFPDINAAIDTAIRQNNTRIYLFGHSTGGLTTALYMSRQPRPQIKALILNSPFLTWNLPKTVRKIAIPLIAALGRIFPDIHIHQKPDTVYAKTLHRNLGGEWDYNRTWKPDILPDPDAGWIRAINIAQKQLRNANITVPVLLLHSDRTAHLGDTFEKYETSDAILNVKTMAEAGRRLGKDITEVTIRNGKHDLVLSKPEIRRLVLDTILQWLNCIDRK